MVKVELSLREARALLRAVSASGRLVYDPRLSGIPAQSEAYRALYNAERSLLNAVGCYAGARGDYCAGYRLAYSWADEPISAPYGSVFKKEVA